GNHFLDFRPHTVGSKGDRLPQQFTEPCRYRPQAVFGFRLPFRPAQMGGENEPPTFFEHVSNRWERRLNAGIVRNPPVRDRDIEGCPSVARRPQLSTPGSPILPSPACSSAR